MTARFFRNQRNTRGHNRAYSQASTVASVRSGNEAARERVRKQAPGEQRIQQSPAANECAISRWVLTRV